MAFTSVDDPTIYFQSKIYTGTGSSNSVTLDGDTNMQPDWVWIKDRSEGNWHNLYDVVRGVTKRIFSNQTSAEETQAAGLTAFGSNGFTVGSNVDVNKSSNNYVAWNWKAGTSFSNDASATGVGTIDSTGSINTDAGFSIISYTGTGSAGTIAHGLGAVPRWYFVKRRDTGSSNWHVYHAGNAATQDIRLNLTEAAFTTDIWNDTAPTSSVFSVKTSVDVNASSGTYIAYCFSEKQGYSKFGTYVGNGNADGTFVYTGFKPAWVMRKVKTGGTGGWAIYDNKREPGNVMAKELFANSNSAEGSFTQMDFLSNGFKFRTNNSAGNGSGQTYIYIAFAESPFVNSNGAPSNAR